MNMIEKVAKAICISRNSTEISYKDYMKCAKAAIEAMREPDRFMFEAGVKEVGADFEIAWQRAIEAALKE